MRNKPFYLGLLFLALVLVGFDVVLFGDDTASVSETTETTASATLPTAGTSLAPDQPMVCGYSTEAPEVPAYASLIRPTDPQVGPKDAAVTFLEFFEPNCPHCINFHSIAKQVKAAYSDRVHFAFKPVVFWPRSAVQAQAMYAAHAEGKFFEMVDAQFGISSTGQGLTEDQVKQAAQSIGMDGDAMMQRISGGVYRGKMMSNRADHQQLGWGYVPAIYINGKLVDNNSRTPECIGQLLEAEMGS